MQEWNDTFIIVPNKSKLLNFWYGGLSSKLFVKSTYNGHCNEAVFVVMNMRSWVACPCNMLWNLRLFIYVFLKAITITQWFSIRGAQQNSKRVTRWLKMIWNKPKQAFKWTKNQVISPLLPYQVWFKIWDDLYIWKRDEKTGHFYNIQISSYASFFNCVKNPC